MTDFLSASTLGTFVSYNMMDSYCFSPVTENLIAFYQYIICNDMKKIEFFYTKLTSESALPILTIARMETELPRCRKSRTLVALPTRAKLRTEIEEPMCMKFITLTPPVTRFRVADVPACPSARRPCIEVADPSLAKQRTERDEPSGARSRTDNLAPNRAMERTDTVDPKLENCSTES